jgi:hypothetical protein
VSIDAASPTLQAGPQVLYFPFVTHRTLPLEVVITSRGETTGYPSYVWVLGYLRNLGDRPLHAVELEVIETWYPHEPVGNTGPSGTPVRVTPALTATLPGQINPFSRVLTLGKAYATLGAVYVADGRLPAQDEARFVALEAGEWEHAGTTLSGTVRNTSVHTVSVVHVVVTTLGDCAWRSGTPESTRLRPGAETAFAAEYFPSSCLDEGVVVLGQGVVEAE